MTGQRLWSRLVAVLAWAILAFLLAPSLIVIPIAFGDQSTIVFPPTRFGVAMFRRFFEEPGWVQSAWLSARVALWTTVIALVTGVSAAYAVARGRFPGRKLFALLLLSPMMIPGVVVALGLYLYFAALGIAGGEVRLILAHSIVTMPFVVITALNGLKQVDPALEQAATILGASRVTVLRRVTIPLIRPSIVAGGLFAFLLSFDEVVISWFVAQPDAATLPVKMFASIQSDVSAILAAISTMLTLISTLVCLAVASIQPIEDGR